MERTIATMIPIAHQGREVSFEAVAYKGEEETDQLLVLVNRQGHGRPTATPLVRLHSGCVTGDIFHSLRCDCHAQLQLALTKVCEAPLGVIVYLPYHEGRGIGLFRKMEAYALQDSGADTVDANVDLGMPIDARDYSLAAHALADLGLREVRLLTNNPAKMRALMENGIRVTETVPLVTEPNRHNARYMKTKRLRMDHTF
ncbi:GTP cyclohydrolase II [Hyphomicrobium sp.]|uniref:GTP cyclohydrolase II n=1 Tax=Hyphomicrobium sp. TaxID=82 RepID=UPI003F729B4D